MLAHKKRAPSGTGSKCIEAMTSPELSPEPAWGGAEKSTCHLFRLLTAPKSCHIRPTSAPHPPHDSPQPPITAPQPPQDGSRHQHCLTRKMKNQSAIFSALQRHPNRATAAPRPHRTRPRPATTAVHPATAPHDSPRHQHGLAQAIKNLSVSFCPCDPTSAWRPHHIRLTTCHNRPTADPQLTRNRPTTASLHHPGK